MNSTMPFRNRAIALKTACAVAAVLLIFVMLQHHFFVEEFKVKLRTSKDVAKTTAPTKKQYQREPFQVQFRPDIYVESNYKGVDPNCLNTIQKFVTSDGDAAIKIPKQSVLETLSKEEIECLYHRYVSTLQQHCALPTRVGPLEEGGWNLCLDDPYKPEANNMIYTLSYVPGRHADFAKKLGERFNGVPNVKVATVPNYRKSRKKSLKTLIEELGHFRKTFDFITLDLGDDAIRFLKDVVQDKLASNIKQIAFILQTTSQETTPKDYMLILETLRDLYDEGFRIVWTGKSFFHIHTNHPKRTGRYYITMVRKLENVNKEQSPFLIPPQEELEKLPKRELGVMYDRYVTSRQIFCKEIVRMGRIPDGGWDVCNDAKYRPPKDCLVYSFGIDNDFSFDDDVADHYGCEVHSFDPSLNIEEHKHAKKVWFHPVGLSDSKKKIKGYRGGYWQLNNLKNIRQELGHENRRIDILKLDIEFAEWSAIPTMIQNNELSDVTQFSIELHTNKREDADPSYIADLLKLKSLYDVGFRTYWSFTNANCKFNAPDSGKEWSGCYELGMLNINHGKS